jgi:hypothetical protein
VIAGAAVLVLLGLGLFVAGILTGVTVLYWACVAACGVAAVLLIVVRRQISTTPAAAAEPAAEPRAADENAGGTAAPADSEAEGAAPVPATSGREPGETGSATGPAAGTAAAAPEDLPDPGVEEVEVTDLLLVVDLKDEVLVVDEHPRYHLVDCSWLAGRETIPLPLDEARGDGFTPCAVCSPDRNLAERARAAKKHSADD